MGIGGFYYLFGVFCVVALIILLCVFEQKEVEITEDDSQTESLMDGSDERMPENQILEINHRIKKNEVARNCLTQNVSERG